MPKCCYTPNVRTYYEGYKSGKEARKGKYKTCVRKI